jgi:hypothetical protein
VHAPTQPMSHHVLHKACFVSIFRYNVIMKSYLKIETKHALSLATYINANFANYSSFLRFYFQMRPLVIDYMNRMNAKGLFLALVHGELKLFLQDLIKYLCEEANARLLTIQPRDPSNTVFKPIQVRNADIDYAEVHKNIDMLIRTYVDTDKEILFSTYQYLADDIEELYNTTDPYNESPDDYRYIAPRNVRMKEKELYFHSQRTFGYVDRVCEIKPITDDVGLLVMYGATERLKTLKQQCFKPIRNGLLKLNDAFPLGYPSRIWAIYEESGFPNNEGIVTDKTDRQVPAWAKNLTGEYDVIVGKVKKARIEPCDDFLFLHTHKKHFLAVGKHGCFGKHLHLTDKLCVNKI